MIKHISALLCFVMFMRTAASGQAVQEGFDYFLQPTTSIPRYIGVTEKKDSGWYRETFLWPEKTIARTAWYKDAECKILHGTLSVYDLEGRLKSRGIYANGKKEGPWVGVDTAGFVNDSVFYKNGKRSGISLKYHDNGFISDSVNIDENGNGVQVSWYDDGTPMQAGAWAQDTLKNKRWVYFHSNGNRRATEDYVMGKKIKSVCFDSTGTAIEGECEEREAAFSGDETGWRKFLLRNLRPNTPVMAGAPLGTYTVVVQFVVTKNGDLTNFKALTKYGYGMEEEVIRMLKKSPQWIPASQFGRLVNAYRKQPVTFAVTSE